MQHLGTVSVQLRSSVDGSLTLCTDRPLSCHQYPSSSDVQTVFRLNKNGRVEADNYNNAWAKQCQSKSVQKLMKVSFCDIFRTYWEKKPFWLKCSKSSKGFPSEYFLCNVIIAATN